MGDAVVGLGTLVCTVSVLGREGRGENEQIWSVDSPVDEDGTVDVGVMSGCVDGGLQGYVGQYL